VTLLHPIYIVHICSYADLTDDDRVSNNHQWKASVNFCVGSNHRSVEIF